MKLVLFQPGGEGEILPGPLTARGVVSIAEAVATVGDRKPQETIEVIIDGFEDLRSVLARLDKTG